MYLRIVAFSLLLGLLATGSFAQQVPSVLHYQASLLQDDQQVEGEIGVTARIYDVESGGQALWSEVWSGVPVEKGRFSLLLGSQTAFPGTLFTEDERYLELEIDGEVLPRLRMASTAYALRAGVAAAVVDGAIQAESLAPDAAVSSVNNITGPLTIEGVNGTTVNADAATGTVTISAPGGDGTSSGILGIQNTDGTIQVVDPNGPTTTLNLQPESIGAGQLARGGVETAKLADEAVTAQKIKDQTITAAKLAPGSVVNSVSAGTGLTGTGTTGAITLGIAENGITSTQLANDAVTAAKLAQNAVNRAALASGVVVDDLNGLTGSVTLAAANGASLSVDNGTITISAEGSGGTITEVTSGTGLTGGGDEGSVTLGVANGGIGSGQLADGAVTTAKLAGDAVTSAKIANGAVSTADLAPGAAVTSLSVGSTSLSGNVGLQGSPNINISRVSGQNAYSIAFTGDLEGSVTSVSGQNGLETLSGTTGDVTLGVAAGGIGSGRLSDGAVTAAKLAANAVNSASVVDNSLTAADLGAGSVGSSEIIDGSVSAADLGAGSVGTSELNTGSNPSADQVLTYDGSGLAWTNTSSGDITRVTGTGGLAGDTQSGDATLSIANEGVTEPKLSATNSPGNGQILSYDGGGQFEWVDASSGGLTSVASNSTLTGDGTSGNPLGLNTNAVASANVVDGSLTAADLGTGSVGTSEIVDGSISSADLGAGSVGTSELDTGSGPSGGQVLTYDGSGLEWTNAASGDITRVTGTGGLTGDTQSGDATVSIASGGVTEGRLADNAVTEPKLNATNSPGGGQVLSYDGGGQFAWVDPSSGGLTSVTSNNTLIGDGTSGSPLGLANDAVTEPRIAASNSAGSGLFLSYNGSSLVWDDPASGTITSVTGTGGLNSTTSGGDVTVSIADGGVTQVRLANNAVTADKVADGTIGEPDLNISNSPSNGLVLGYSSGSLAWTSSSTSVSTDGATIVGDGSSTPLSIPDGGVGSAQIGGGAVGPTELANDAVTSSAVANNTLTADDLAAGSVGTSEIADASIAAADINASGATDGYVLTYSSTAAGNLVWDVDDGGTTSSRRFKTDIVTIADAQAIVDQLRGVRYNWKDDGRADVGLVAEEVAEVLPELVTYEADDTTVRGLRYGPLVSVLIEAAKVQQSELDAANDTIDAQEAKIEELDARLARLEALVGSMKSVEESSTP